MMPPLRKLLSLIIMGPLTYIIMEKLLPRKKNKSEDEKIPRGVINRFLKKTIPNRNLIAALIITILISVYDQEIVTLLSNAMAISYVDKNRASTMIKTLIKETNVGILPESIQSHFSKKFPSPRDRQEWVQAKFKAILSGPHTKKELIMSLSVLIAFFLVNKLGGLAFILSALKELFEEGTISESMYLVLKNAAIENACDDNP